MADGIYVKIFGDDSDLQSKLAKSASALAKWGAAAATAAVTASVEITRRTAESAREIDNLSRLISINSAEFQRNSAAARTVGIEQQKYADIMKDVQDKVGDFLANGAGPMQDFFKNIAPQVGVTAEQFRNLSGPDALQLYVNSLQKANVNQNEMTFYMEAIASDAALLTPLLRDNGAALNELGNQAELAGAVLSDIEIEQMLQLNRALDQAGLYATGLSNDIATELAPILSGLVDEFSAIAGETDVMGETVTRAVNAAIAGAGYVANAWRGVQIVVDGLVLAYHGLKAAALSVALSIGDGIDAVVQGGVQSINGLIDLANNVTGLNMSKLVVGESEALATVRKWAVDANQAFIEATDNLHNRLMEPLPSESLDEWVGVVRERSEARAIAAAEAKEAEREQDQVWFDEDLERERERYATQLAELEAYEAAKSGSIKLWKADEIKTEEDMAAAKKAIDQASLKARLQVASSMMGNLSSLMDTENRKLFNIGKVAALAQATIDGYSAIQSSYAQGSKIGGPALGAAFAATAAIATGVQIARIASTSFGSGGTGAPAAAASSNPNVNADQMVGGSGGGAQQERVFRLEGLSADSLYTGDQLMRLADNLVELQNDGYRLVPT